jgi:hypothetical protein
VATQRILRAAAATLTLSTFNADGTLADVVEPVTVGVTRADGTVLLAAGTATGHTEDTGLYTVALTAVHTALLNRLIATWTAADGSTWVTHHDVVGGFTFSIADARASDRTLLDAAKYPDAAIIATRAEVEDELEQICDRAFIPRYARVQLDGSGTDTLNLPATEIRTVRSARIYPSADLTSSGYRTLTAAQLNALRILPNGVVRRTDFAAWDEGAGNIVIELEYGFDTPFADLKRAVLTRLRTRLTEPGAGIAERAVSITTEEGTYRLDTADAYKTGIPSVDAVYDRYSNRKQGDDLVPVSMPFRLNPQKWSMWHGGN